MPFALLRAADCATAGVGEQSADESGTAVGDPQEDFSTFFERSYRPLSRLAYLLTSDHAAADDLTGDTMLAVWRQWDRVQAVDNPQAYVRRVMANLAATRIRRTVRERMRLAQLWPFETSVDPDSTVTVAVQAALAALPPGRRACVVLRHAFDLSEREAADLLGLSVGTVKSQTSKAIKQLTAALGPAAQDWPEERS